MEARRERATLTLTPSEREDAVLVARATGVTLSQLLRDATVADIVERAAAIRDSR